MPDRSRPEVDASAHTDGGGVADGALPHDGGAPADGSVDGGADVDAGSGRDGGARVDGGRDGGPACRDTLCGIDCVDVRTDARNCGACSRDCTALPGVAPSGVACEAGRCVVSGCAEGRADCNARSTDGCETSLFTARDCARCGDSCPPSEPLCARSGDAASCVSGCSGDSPTRCEGSCVDTGSDTAHCGRCGHSCEPPRGGTVACVEGDCAPACPAGTHLCGDRCLSNASATSCGTRCTPCAAPDNATPTCDVGACGYRCNEGFHDCDGRCVPNDDVATCGGRCAPCDAPDHASPTCDGASCRFSCDTDYHACDGVCVSRWSPASCGSRCTPCPAPENGRASCDGSACTYRCDWGYNDCGGACVESTSVSACGASCAVCATPENGRATCDGTSCGVACDDGYEACDDRCVADAPSWRTHPAGPFGFIPSGMLDLQWGFDRSGTLWYAWMEEDEDFVGTSYVEVYVAAEGGTASRVHRARGTHYEQGYGVAMVEGPGGELCFLHHNPTETRRACRSTGFESSVLGRYGSEIAVTHDDTGGWHVVHAHTDRIAYSHVGVSSSTIEAFPSGVTVPVQDAAVDVDADGHPHVIYMVEDRGSLWAKYARHDGRTWTVRTLEEVNRAPVHSMGFVDGGVAVAVALSGDVHLAWVRRWRRVITGAPDEVREDVRYSVFGGGSLSGPETLYPGFAAGYDRGWNTNQVRLALDEAGVPMIAYSHVESGRSPSTEYRRVTVGRLMEDGGFDETSMASVQGHQLGRLGIDRRGRPTLLKAYDLRYLGVCP